MFNKKRISFLEDELYKVYKKNEELEKTINKLTDYLGLVKKDYVKSEEHEELLGCATWTMGSTDSNFKNIEKKVIDWKYAKKKK